MAKSKSIKRVLIVIVLAQFLCTSIWFASNGVINDLITTFSFSGSALGHLTSAIQFGFIVGTLLFAIFTISDRYSPSKVFFVCAIIAALCNIGVLWENHSFWSIILLRSLTGVFLAGIYPVGMKIAADYFDHGLGISLSYLVGALVLGTALPHLISALTISFSWKSVFITTSALSIIGGLLMVFLVPDGPYRKPSQRFDFSAFYSVFKDFKFRSAAFGYFGHMWELYTFWAFIPYLLVIFKSTHSIQSINVPLWSFLIIAVGAVSCVIGGHISKIFGVKRTAFIALLASGLCCLVAPFILAINSTFICLSFFLFWGMVVITDSPLFSTLVAKNATPNIKGTALTIVNCIGFAITILSIQLISYLVNLTDSNTVFMLLAVGPILGLIALNK